MPNFNTFKKKLLEGSIDLVADTIKVALLTSSYVPNADHEFLPQISGYQVVDVGYAAGGKPLVTKIIVQDTKKSYYRADPLEWEITGTIKVKYIALYKDTGVAGTSSLICFIELDPSKVAINSTFRIAWNPLGIIELY